ncbi:hypothetical protein SPRG_05128 [Saprolegnia parasitica CBS 223.65]|uniref:MalT-like TPR region domain-containing protein n=1 Tax=Saprolegnia parasitica (strain CBS 223.65) TaxID=695850 RepID=A0A067CHE7_SAPPC|nr:hypothetical protein SPRG_05128 [Saprolegnia parasitica CBS 223.65]KDO29938.1 hypothetical protein SPRG_05128 [Saprolegnia parasitica CBS 223.65]|eukprot:XP_012199122.1 hypothetical protein SPRG_05128 [Saprolegnia parasitica CBS 223.65]
MMARATTVGLVGLRSSGWRQVRHVHQRQFKSYEALRADFHEWLKKEVKLVSLFLATGLSVVFAYAYRDNSPVRQMQYILAEATAVAEGGDKQRARQLTQRAYAIAGSVSDREPHLYELAFSIAAQYEAARQFDMAKKFYHEAMTHAAHAKHAAKHVGLYRMVTLDRIAECCHNLGDVSGAATYYQRALDIYEKDRGTAKDQMDAEVCGIWFNYARLCMDSRQYTEGGRLLQKATQCARENDLPEDKRAQIHELAAQLGAAPRPTFNALVGGGVDI